MKEGIDTWGQGKSLSYHLLLFQVRSTFWIYQSDTSVLRLVSPTSFYLLLALSGTSIDIYIYIYTHTHTHTHIYIYIYITSENLSWEIQFSKCHYGKHRNFKFENICGGLEMKCYALEKEEKYKKIVRGKTRRREIICRPRHWREDNIKVHLRE